MTINEAITHCHEKAKELIIRKAFEESEAEE